MPQNDNDLPTPEEFAETCRAAFMFVVVEYGFREVPCSDLPERFCIRFARDQRVIEIRGEGYGTTAACRVFCGDKGPLSLIYLVPHPMRPKRSRRRDRMGQLDHIREWADLARAHAREFLGGDTSRFEAAWDAESKTRQYFHDEWS